MIRAKKSLGQNFLIDDIVLNQIVNCVAIENKAVLEIGPGTGNLTRYILNKKPKHFTVIEKDNVLVKKLNDRFKEKLNIINKEPDIKIEKVYEQKLINQKKEHNDRLSELIKLMTVKMEKYTEYLLLWLQSIPLFNKIANTNI